VSSDDAAFVVACAHPRELQHGHMLARPNGKAGARLEVLP
jgi:hypothetical protein